jgi:ribosomal protein S18 acetylase RimI-like enzyme
MEIKIVPRNMLKTANLTLLIETVYDNFINLSKHPKLNHTRENIKKILKSDNSYVIFILENKKIIGYLVAQSVLLNDGRLVFYIYYLFTSNKFRNMGIASKLLEFSKNISNKDNCIGIMLTCDTEDVKVYDFYLKKGFMPDMLMRTYNRYDVLYL